jgi:NitT/TauT family transport system substrate-binding protein
MNAQSIRQMFAGAALAVALAQGAAAQAPAIEFNLSWLPQGSTAGVIVAAHLGYYAEEGLDVTPVRGFGGVRTINELAQGMFMFGYGNPDAIVLNRAAGGTTRLVGSVNSTNPGGICYVQERHSITSLDDMAGLTLGVAAGTPVNVTFPALLRRHGLPEDHVEFVQLQGAVIVSALLTGQIDIYECWRGSGRALLIQQARNHGVTIGYLSYEDLGLDTLGSGIATTDAVIEQHPEIVAAVLRATYRGYEFLRENPEGAADIVVLLHPEINREAVLMQIHDINELLVAPGTEANGVGWIDPVRMEALVAFIAEANELATPVAPEDVYTNAFIGN